MRIAYLTADFGVPVLGTKGASAHVRGLVQALRAEGHDVLVLAASTGHGSPARFPIWEVPFSGFLPALYETLQQEDICQRTRLAKDLRNLLYSSNLELHGRHALEEFGPDLIYERSCLLSTAGLGLARDLRVPLMLEVNAPLVLEQQQMRGLSLPLIARAAERFVLTGADHVVAVSRAVCAHVVGLGVAADRVSVVPNAADPHVFRPAAGRSPTRRQLAWNDRFVIGFVGSMKPWHGVDTLLNALHQLGGRNSGFRLLLVGSGPELTDLHRESQRLELGDAVHMTGAVPHDAVPGLLRAMDVAVAPYAAGAGEYFSPVKLFEYMAAARPVVAARAGQVCDVIEDGRTGCLYPAGDAVALAAVIRRLAADRDLCRSLGAAARASVLRQYTWRHNAQRVIAIAGQLLAKGQPAGRTADRKAAFDAPNGLRAGRPDRRRARDAGSRDAGQLPCRRPAAPRELPQ